MSMRMFDVGHIVNTHGVNGELRIVSLTDFEERFDVGHTLYLVKDNEPPLLLTIATRRAHKQFILVQFENYTNINDVEPFKGGTLKIKEEQLFDLSDNEYYHHDIIGCTTYTTDGEKLGTIKEILSPGANDVWVVQQPNGKDILIPYISQVVKEVIVDEQKVIIELMEGLLD